MFTKFPQLPTFVVMGTFLAFATPHALSEVSETKESKPQVPAQAIPEKEQPAKPEKKKRAPKKRPIIPSDYGRWESLRQEPGGLSENGKWLAYTVTRVDRKQTLQLHDLTSEDAAKPVESIDQGGSPVFSKDSRWLAFSIVMTPDELKKLQIAAKASGGRDSGPKGRTIKLRDLKDGKTTEIKSVKSFRFSEDSRFIAIEIEGSTGGFLIVRDLKKGTDTSFGNVTKFAWSDGGSLLAMVVDSPSISNTLQVFDPRRGRLRTLDSSEREYTAMNWMKDAMDLVVSREMEHGKDEDVSHVLMAWRDLDKVGHRDAAAAVTYDHLENKDFPDAMYIAAGTPRWTRDGRGVLVELREWEKRPKAPKMDDKDKGSKDNVKAKDGQKPAAGKDDAKKDSDPKKPSDGEAKTNKPADEKKNVEGEKPDKKDSKPTNQQEEKPPVLKTLRESLDGNSNVEVWHAKDVEIMPLQKKRAERKDNPRRTAIWWPEDSKLVPLGTEPTEEVQMLRSGDFAVGLDQTPHEATAMFGPNLADVFLINTRDGEKKRVLEGVEFQLNSSPDGKWLIYVHHGNIWSYEVDSGKRRNLTEKLDSAFTNQEDDSLAKEKKPYGRGLWLADGSGVLLDGRFDVWLVRPDGSAARKLTDGAKKMIRHRVDSGTFIPDDEGLIDPERPLYFSIYGDRSKKSGYARMSIANDATDESPEVLIWEKKSINSLNRAAKNGDIYTFVKESFRDSPNLFVSGPKLAKPKKVSATNSFQKDFRWGRSRLVNYVNENGVKLQGALIYPANYRKGRKYPMVTYIYERLSQNLHRYSVPSETHPYNPSVFSAEGYFVFMPDIVYRPQEPGPSAVECIVPAVKAVLETGMVDADRVALIGHSWGAYQTAFTVTNTNIFAAGVAGAPLTNMMSMSMQVYWNSGDTNARIFGISQGRMNKPFWSDQKNFTRNSPIYGMDRLRTPLLVAFGDKDGAVDFSQGVEMYNAARFAKKENFVMLVYPGENHSLGRQENQVDYHYKILEWLAHYLKDTKGPKWITEGKSYLERKKELKEKDLDKKM